MQYSKTLTACYRGYVVQAVINNLSPLLFVTFASLYGIPVTGLSVLILVNFVTQIAADVFCVLFGDKLGLRRGMLLAHAFATAGLALLALLPGLLPSPFVGLAIATMVCAWGGGLLEALVSPVVDLIPSDAKAAGMSLLHSFYCWGQVAVVLLSTLLLRFLGAGLWWVLPLLWALLPAFNLLAFRKVPIPQDGAAQSTRQPLGNLWKQGMFWLAMLLMVAAGASELGMSQWSSAFAEVGLGVDKTLGDLLGPCLFAVFMGLGRTVHGIWGEKIPLRPVLLASAALCAGCYLLAALSPLPFFALVGCALCGLAISLFWPGVYSLASAGLHGGTPMFGVFAIMGDIGCSIGPWLVGFAAGAAGGVEHLAKGLLVGTAFPVVMFVGILFFRPKGSPGKSNL